MRIDYAYQRPKHEKLASLIDDYNIGTECIWCSRRIKNVFFRVFVRVFVVKQGPLLVWIWPCFLDVSYFIIDSKFEEPMARGTKLVAGKSNTWRRTNGFPISGAHCDITCTGRSDIDPAQDENNITYHNMVNCIGEKCIIQSGMLCVLGIWLLWTVSQEVICSTCLSDSVRNANVWKPWMK